MLRTRVADGAVGPADEEQTLVVLRGRKIVNDPRSISLSGQVEHIGRDREDVGRQAFRVGVALDQLGEGISFELDQQIESCGARQVVEPVAVLEVFHLGLEDVVEGRAQEPAEDRRLFGEAADPQVDVIDPGRCPAVDGDIGAGAVEEVACVGHAGIEIQDRLGSDKASIPVEVEGAKILYVPLSGAHTITPPATVFNAVGESWTISMFEAANYATYVGDVPKAKRITERILREAERLKVEEIVIAECGHAYHALRWEAPKWFGGPLPFRVRSILEVVDEYVRAGRLSLNPANNPEPVTLHDSCNLGRKGGLFEEPRRVVRAAAEDFREMTPNRERSFCCGAGSGLVAMPEWEDIRLKAGGPKAEQVGATGARIVIASCDNGRHQLTELNEHYGLNVQVMGLAELVVQALVPGSA